MIIATLAICAVPVSADAQPRCAQPAAIVQIIVQQVEVVPASTGAPVRATRNMPVCAGETVQVAPRSRAQVFIVASNSRLVLEENSRLVIGATNAPQPNVTLLRGALLFITRLRRAFEVRTPFVNASVEGTEFVVRVGANDTTVTVLEGTVRAANDLGNVLVGAGQQAVAAKGQAPQLQVVVRPRDAVQWAIYYEPVLPADTFEAIDAVPAANQNAAFFARRAALLLSVGQLEAARADLDQAQKLDAGYGDAYAVRAITAVALNDKTQALENGRRAVELSPNSTAARLALSYALQANFQLEEARDVVAQAVTNDANNASALARLAELRLMLDDVGGAAEAAERAVKLAPESGRPRVVLGFIQLAQLKVGDAERTFDQALDLQSNDPLAHLGYGLAQIRRGRLEAGRGELETAVALNPENAIVRSYLGKAYFDEKRDALAGEQFASAKALDPLDPTAYYYDAIRQQTINRPVEALANVQQAIQLNDNRVVYRSRFLLDQDLAARAASLGRLYRDLRFEQIALLEGWKSVDTSPGDHSGHRLLADSYSALPRHELARVSEVLQSQLLQPINITAVPPSLAEADLFILEGAGPSATALNEFNPLFNRNRVAAQFRDVHGNRGLFGEEFTVSGVWNRLSFSAGQFHFETDGVRPNNGQNRDLYNAFVQNQLTHRTMVQAEFRLDEARSGDLIIRFDPTDFSAQLERDVRTRTARIGVRHVFTPRSQLIASGYVQRRKLQLAETVLGIGPTPTTTQNTYSVFDGWTAELQHIFQTPRFSVISGIGRFRSESAIDLETRFGPPINRTRTSHTTDHPEQDNAYVYSTFSPVDKLHVKFGLSVDAFDRGVIDRTQVNPKIGVTWIPEPATTIRIAAFRTLRRSVISGQTIEPTQVAGFNQLYADFAQDGLDARNYGIAVDRRFRPSMFGGASYLWRNFDLPLIESGQVVPLHPNEQIGRSYFYWTPANLLSASAVYQFERFDREPGAALAAGFVKIRTHRVPITLTSFLRSGLTASVVGTYVNQHGIFVRGSQYQGADRFWTVDAAIGYRLPRRFGTFVIEMRNLFDEEFRFQDTDPGNPAIQRGRLALARLTLGI
jgi:tetratricopeptide (TPR) repeat protein